jgi:GNAT superfamily N-acetyltransferase
MQPTALGSRQPVAMASSSDVLTTAAIPNHSSIPPASRAKTAIEAFSGPDITDEMLEKAAELFSEHYGVWSQHAPNNKPGSRVRMSASRLRKQCLPLEALDDCTYIRYLQNGKLVGNAFACTWNYPWEYDKRKIRQICWITQLVVETSMRGQGIATKMLQVLRELSTYCYGIITSHPYACNAMAHAFEETATVGLEKTRDRAKDFIDDYGESLLKSSPIEYVRSAQLRRIPNHGDPDDHTEDTVNTSFFVDHSEQKAILETMDGSRTIAGAWYWGELLEGHEHFMVVQPELGVWRDHISMYRKYQACLRRKDAQDGTEPDVTDQRPS